MTVEHVEINRSPPSGSVGLENGDSHVSQPSENKHWRRYVLVAGISIVILSMAILFHSDGRQKSTPTDTAMDNYEREVNADVLASPTPTIYRPPLAQGKQVFEVQDSSGRDEPMIRSITIDPYDPQPGSGQEILVSASFHRDITDVSLVIETDNHSVSSQMDLYEGSTTDGVWQTTVVHSDTHYSKYVFSVDVGGDGSTNSITLTGR